MSLNKKLIINEIKTPEQNKKSNIVKLLSLSEKTQIVTKYTELVKRIAYHLKGRLPDSVQVEDLIQSGMIGLLEAAQKYSATQGASFETFVGIRIKGSMIDDIRKYDWTPRSVNKNSRLIAEAISTLESKLGRDPTSNEITKHLNVSIDEYNSILNDVSSSKIIGIEDLGVKDDSIINMADFKSQTPHDEIEKERFQKALVSVINQLPEKELQVVSLYYNEELNLKEIGLVIGVGESRVSQILSQAIHRIKGKLNNWKN
jgi:RNA polymerase sigma factor for flagellar operon FliA